MGRFKEKAMSVRGAVLEQVDYLKWASHRNAWGIKVGLEELSKGFSHTEDMVVSIFIPYCETGFEWEVVIDGEAPDRCPDLIPLPSTEAEVSKGFVPAMMDTYELYRMGSLPSLKKWDLLRRQDSLVLLVNDLKRIRRENEEMKLSRSPLKSAMFQFEAVRDRQDEVEVLLSRSGLRMIFPLWKDQGEEDEDAEAATDTGPIFVYGRAGIKLRLEWMQMSEGERPGVKVIFPPEAQGLARGFRQPTWTMGMTLYDYLPLAQSAVADPWRLRKQLVATFAAKHSVLEYDAQDFTFIYLFMKVKLDNFVHLRTLRLDIGPDFPEFPPHMTLCDALSEQSWPLDRRAYLYSPRWDAERMASELYTHAASTISRVT